jgi:hypothetical protein
MTTVIYITKSPHFFAFIRFIIFASINQKFIIMKGIYRLNFDCGRQGHLSGIFVADSKHVELLISSQTQVYFGEVLGKHSEVCGPVQENEISLVTDDQQAVTVFEKFKLQTGFNPFDYDALGSDGTVLETVEELILRSDSTRPIVFPKYVKFKTGDTVFCAKDSVSNPSDKDKQWYWVDAGSWGLYGVYKQGILYTQTIHLADDQLLEATEDEWKKANEGYI